MDYIKSKILDKKIACESFNTNNKNYDAFLKLQTISAELSETTLKRTNYYHCHLSDKLNDPGTSAKAYWSILKSLHNEKKIQLIPPILVKNYSLYQILRRKQTISVIFSHLILVKSLMTVLYPIKQILFLMLVYHPLSPKTKMFLILYAPLTTTKLMVMMIFVRLLTICNSSTVKPLSIIFKNCKSNVVPIHKKVTSNCCKIITQFCFCQDLVKFSKKLSSNQCLNFFKKIIFSVHTNLDFVHLTQVKASYYPLFISNHCL